MTTAAAIVLAVAFGLAMLIIIVQMGLGIAGFDADAARIADRLASGNTERALVTRWLERSRWFRHLGGIAGLLFGTLTFQSIGRGLTFSLLGLAAGSLLAEAHLLGVSAPRQRRLGDLRARSVTDYWAPREQFALAALALVAIVLLVQELIGGELTISTAWAIAALMVVGVCLMCQWRTATRRRPVLGDGLRNADDLVRHLAITRGMARPATMAVLVLLANATATSTSDGSAGDVLSLGLWITALAVFWKNRRLGLDYLLDTPGAPVEVSR